MGHGGRRLVATRAAATDTEERIAEFADLVATAIAAAAARAELIDSRARIVAAAETPGAAWNAICTTASSKD